MREGESPSHRRNVASLPCLVTGQRPCDPHHLKRIGLDNERGTGYRNADRWAIPLLRRIHDVVEAQPDDVLYLSTRYGVDAKAIAEALWERQANKAAMYLVIVHDLARRGIAIAY